MPNRPARARRLGAAVSLMLLTVVSCGTADDADEAGLASGSPGSEALTAQTGGLEITAVAPARPVTATDEHQHLLYELLFQNSAATAVQLRRIDVEDGPHRPPLATYAGAALAAILIVPVDPTGSGLTIPAGGLAVAFLDVVPAPGCRLPAAFTHRIVVQPADRAAAAVSGPSVPVIADGAHRIGPPLRGGHLLDLNGCCDSNHRRALLGFDSGLFLAQRFAIDFVRVDQKATFAGDPAKNESYFLYGADVIAATPGRIVATRDGVAQNVPTEPLPPATIESAPGNYVIEALDDGRFALYAHVQPGSLRVAPGERVHRGQVLALVGNSGNSTEPHLHFHVTDRPSPLEADGLPYIFDRFELQGTVDLGGPEPVIVPVPPPQRRRDRLPMNLDVLEFP
jgi:murein DD-endopeptidase MepM/ murein hydrolase activator NlpD